MGGILNAIEVSSQGLSVQRAKMNTVAENMANAETVEGPDGQPYRRQRVIVTAEKNRNSFRSELAGARNRLAQTHAGHRAGSRQSVTRGEAEFEVTQEVEVDKDAGFRLEYDPTHPNADEEGFVKMPNIEVVHEMVDMMTASRGYEANTSVISTAKKMAQNALEI